MPYRELPLKSSYESGEDDLIQEFYLPVLERAVLYRRIAGFFSSSSLAIAARGIAGLIKGGGKMRLLACPRLSSEDAQAVISAAGGARDFLEGKLLAELESIEDAFERDHVGALGWMLANGFLEMRLVQSIDPLDPYLERGIFHQKVGLLEDKSGNRLSFSGSINESASGWVHNVEEFKVFREWLPGHEEFFVSDNRRFEQFWDGKRTNVRVFDLPQAVKKRLIEQSKDFSKERFIVQSYQTRRTSFVQNRLSLFPYQQEAVRMWKENEYRLMLEMATGTGKSRTALGCVERAMQREGRLVVFIACPQTTLSRQWKEKEVEPAGFPFDACVFADGTNSKWRSELATALLQISVGYFRYAVVYTTHTTCSGADFIELVEKQGAGVPMLFIGDEAHGLGAYRSKRALLSRYEYRIGLSATPTRWFDNYGTQVLTSYFGGKSFFFPISEALTTINPITNKTFLVDYYYRPVFVTLTEDELESYMQLSDKIARLSHYSADSDEYQGRYEALLYARADIQKNACNKLPALEKLLRGEVPVHDMLLFVSEEQMDAVLQILKRQHIIAHRFTQMQGTTPSKAYGGLSERQYLIERFAAGDYQALAAISCLDEGIDIPGAQTAVLLSNSTNPREYVQRIGRVVRRAPGKTCARIFDFLVVPDASVPMPAEIRRFEAEIFEKELIRALDMSLHALNNAEMRCLLDKKLEEVREYGAQ